jgi:hypothetical protein
MQGYLNEGRIAPQARCCNLSTRLFSYLNMVSKDKGSESAVQGQRDWTDMYCAHRQRIIRVCAGSTISSTPNLFAVRTGFCRFMYSASRRAYSSLRLSPARFKSARWLTVPC